MMGGTQSWLNCDANYRVASPDQTGDQSDSAGGDPIIAVMMFLGTLFGLLFLTALAHCGFIAWRGCRHRHSRRQKPTTQVHFHQDDAGINQLSTTTGAGTAAGALSPEQGDGGLGEDGDNEDGESSTCSSSSLTSSESSLDSTTARIAAQVASRRRSRFLDLAGVRLPGATGGAASSGASHTPSPTSSWRPTDGVVIIGGGGGGGNFLRPPLPRGAFENQAYDYRYDP